MKSLSNPTVLFQHTAARRRLAFHNFSPDLAIEVSTHSRPKAAGKNTKRSSFRAIVSTHSRPKAAGQLLLHLFAYPESFNTQPPEGGWGYGHTG